MESRKLQRPKTETNLVNVSLFLIILSLILYFPSRAYATPGHLDPSFGSGGEVTTSIGVTNDETYALAVQPDGKTVAAGYSITGSQTVFALTRYNTDGSLDATFGSGGIVTTAI